jgi:hypothetical protein
MSTTETTIVIAAGTEYECHTEYRHPAAGMWEWEETGDGGPGVADHDMTADDLEAWAEDAATSYVRECRDEDRRKAVSDRDRDSGTWTEAEIEAAEEAASRDYRIVWLDSEGEILATADVPEI